MSGIHRQRGLTLIELMFVTAMIGILMSVAAPAYETYRNRAQFAEVMSMVSLYKNAAEISAGAGRINSLQDLEEGSNGIPDGQGQNKNQHGVHLRNGEIEVQWKRDGTALEGVTFTLTAQNFTPPIRWVRGGSCQALGFC